MVDWLGRIVIAALVRLPDWLIICLAYTIGGLIIGAVAYGLGHALGRAVHPVLILASGVGSLALGFYAIWEDR